MEIKDNALPVLMGYVDSFGAVGSVTLSAADASRKDHGNLSMSRHPMRWRFYTGEKVVAWAEKPDGEKQQMVSEYLNRRGFAEVRHKTQLEFFFPDRTFIT